MFASSTFKSDSQFATSASVVVVVVHRLLPLKEIGLKELSWPPCFFLKKSDVLRRQP